MFRANFLRLQGREFPRLSLRPVPITGSGIRLRHNRASSSPIQEAFKFGEEEDEDKRSNYKVVNPDVPNIENLPKRWEKLQHLDQEDIQLFLEDRMRGDWKELTLLEKQASKYPQSVVSFQLSVVSFVFPLTQYGLFLTGVGVLELLSLTILVPCTTIISR